MTTRALLAAALTVAMTGCATLKATLLPVEGPLSLAVPVPLIVATATGSGGAGNLSFVMPDGETCQGRWSRSRHFVAAKMTCRASFWSRCDPHSGRKLLIATPSIDSGVRPLCAF